MKLQVAFGCFLLIDDRCNFSGYEFIRDRFFRDAFVCLVSQCSFRIRNDDARDGLEENTIFFQNLIGWSYHNPALLFYCIQVHACNQALNLILQNLPVAA